jgi:hypothetical protein
MGASGYAAWLVTMAFGLPRWIGTAAGLAGRAVVK